MFNLIRYIYIYKTLVLEWIDSFFETNRQRMKEARDYLIGKLNEMGVEAMPSHAGFFVLANFGKVSLHDYNYELKY